MFKLMSRRTYEMKCEKGYFMLHIEDIEETFVNGENSTLKYEVEYKMSKNHGMTTFLIGGWIPVSKTEKEFVEEELDFILYSDYYDGMIESHIEEMDVLEERSVEEFRKMQNKKEGLKIIKDWLELMEHEVIKLDEDEVITYDQVEEERTENDTVYWCEWIIETLESRLRNNPDMEEDVIEQYNEEIRVLKILGDI